MLDWIVMDVIQMSMPIILITNAMLPKSSLPEALHAMLKCCSKAIDVFD
jgi:hypothetical protein